MRILDWRNRFALSINIIGPFGKDAHDRPFDTQANDRLISLNPVSKIAFNQ
ncbi:hypothetical protein D1AOALGA4SA_2257 [Olavius algarvensis Delta 1 endosymbiont]|nr:hypothetical protein D1AOALGA4SA_2257 [Olavius algarvensis Delta 1 endosymbiont]